ncbi:MAG: rod shape-determining protein MreD [Bacteroidota bacterium]
MLNEVLKNIGRFFLLVFLQGMILNDINLLDGYAIPYLYIMVMLMLPMETPRWLELLIGLVLGLSMDMFTNTVGIHASACVFLAFLRPVYLTAIAPRDGYEFGQQPSIADQGLSWYLRYISVLVLAHHFWLFYVEVYSFKGFFSTLLRVVLSSAFTLALLVLSQYLVYNSKRTSVV